LAITILKSFIKLHLVFVLIKFKDFIEFKV
jgi:hypothetical protein